MIMTATELRQHIETNLEDSVLEDKLQALELLIRKYTNNNFQNRIIRFECDSVATILNGSSPYLKIGDTVQISESRVNDGLYLVKEISEQSIVVDRPLFTVPKNLVTKVEYPMDVKMGVVNMMKWDLENRDKVGIASESISRHSVTYFDMGSSNTSVGYPVSLVGFLMPYKKARF